MKPLQHYFFPISIVKISKRFLILVKFDNLFLNYLKRFKILKRFLVLTCFSFMGKIEEQKTHYDRLLEHIERMLETYKNYKDHPEDFVEFGIIAKEQLGKEEERTAYTQLINDIKQLFFEARIRY